MNSPAAPRVPVADWIDTLIRYVAYVMCIANAFLIAVIITQVVMRYGFGRGQVILEELMWHLYAIGVMFGMSWSMVRDAHVRVDLLHARFSPKVKAVIEILGILFLLLPFLWVVFDHSLDFVYDSWRINERSNAPTGLPMRWLIKAVIPASFGLLILAALSRLLREFAVLLRRS